MSIATDILAAREDDYSVSVPEMARTRGAWYDAENSRFGFPDESSIEYSSELDDWIVAGWCSEHGCPDTECATHAHYPAATPTE